MDLANCTTLSSGRPKVSDVSVESVFLREVPSDPRYADAREQAEELTRRLNEAGPNDPYPTIDDLQLLGMSFYSANEQ